MSPVGGILNITGTEHKRLLRTLENAGTAVYDGINLSFATLSGSAGVINNLAGGVFTVSGEGDFVPLNAGAHAFNNAGTFVKQGQGTTSSFFHGVTGGVPFHNNGSIDVQQGVLYLPEGGVAQFNGTDRLSLRNATTLTLPAGLIGSTTNADLFTGLGTLTLQGGTFAAPTPLEVMGATWATLRLDTIATLRMTGCSLPRHTSACRI